MKTQESRNNETHDRGERWGPKASNMKKKNMQRLGGSGLSLEAFANAKSKNNGYNPALLKKKREFYKNAKHVNKYKKMVKQQNQQSDPSSSGQLAEEDVGKASMKGKKNRGGSYSLKGIYEKKREEEEKARMEREAIMKAKKEEKEKAEARRKDLKEKMYKKTRRGQPVMKYKIEQILETLQGSTS